MSNKHNQIKIILDHRLNIRFLLKTQTNSWPLFQETHMFIRIVMRLWNSKAPQTPLKTGTSFIECIAEMKVKKHNLFKYLHHGLFSEQVSFYTLNTFKLCLFHNVAIFCLHGSLWVLWFRHWKTHTDTGKHPAIMSRNCHHLVHHNSKNGAGKDKFGKNTEHQVSHNHIHVL